LRQLQFSWYIPPDSAAALPLSPKNLPCKKAALRHILSIRIHYTGLPASMQRKKAFQIAVAPESPVAEKYMPVDALDIASKDG